MLLESLLMREAILVVGLLAPYQRGGKIGLFGGVGVGKTVLIMELINNVAKAHEIVCMVSAINRYVEDIDESLRFISSDSSFSASPITPPPSSLSSSASPITVPPPPPPPRRHPR
ncbi:hypothetical protein L6452_08324 [Arctium lappa]|uniref:Uncharacterized protein n=1 Tax=Arctium lappa TaxID=4217 RepID=A0ACB9DGX0_ARCLA|nr:hypothetical protein L6452_08324 [Arctium lappa]